MKINPWKKAKYFSLALILSSAITTQIPDMAVRAIDDTEIISEQLDMPIVSITSESSISSKENYVNAQISVFDENGTTQLDSNDISIRLRGNSTMQSNKKSYRIKFDKKQNLLDIGDGAGKSWNLVSSCYDTSLLRHMTAYRLGDMFDNMPYTPNCRNVEVYLNGQYQGVYLLVEAVNANKSRINITEDSTLIEDQGYIIEMTRYATENYFDVGTQRFEIKTDLSEDKETADLQKEYISSYIENCYKTIEEGTFEEVDKLVDIDSFVDIYIVSEIVKNVDAGWDSFYMFKDGGGKLTFGPVWDFDLALGNFIDVKGFDSWKGLNVYDVANISSNSNPWFCNIIKQKWFRELVQERWNEKINEMETIDEFIVDEASENSGSYSRNFTKWKVLGTKVFSEPDEIASLATHTAHAEYLSDWVENRINWLDEYFNDSKFIDGVLIDEEGKIISEDVNIAEYTTKFMMFASDYTIDDTPSFTINFSGSTMFQQCMSGVMLEEGQEYMVSFDYKSTADMKLTWKIQKNYSPWSAYNSDSVTVTDEAAHYETTFTAKSTDCNCAFVFDGSGVSGKTLTVSNIVLKKVSSQEFQKGDINNDGKISVLDVIALQKWFLCGESIKNTDLADLNDDGKVNISDFCHLKSLIIS